MVQLDKVVTDLSVATGDSRSSVKDLLKDYNSMAKQLASTTTQVGQAADDYWYNSEGKADIYSYPYAYA